MGEISFCNKPRIKFKTMSYCQCFSSEKKIIKISWVKVTQFSKLCELTECSLVVENCWSFLFPIPGLKFKKLESTAEWIIIQG